MVSVTGKQAQWKRVEIEQYSDQGKRLKVKLLGIKTRKQGESMIGMVIAVEESQLPVLSEGEFYWKQLIGLQVENLQGHKLGTVDDLVETGANDVLVVVSEQWGKYQERLLPWISDVIIGVDLSRSLIKVDWAADF